MRDINLRFLLLITIFMSGLFIVLGGVAPELIKTNNCNDSSKGVIKFRENKGQVKDQNGWPRPDVHYFCTAGDIHVHFKNNSLSYQMFRVDTWEKPDTFVYDKRKYDLEVPDLISVYRTDLYWEGANPLSRIEVEAPTRGYSNYYNVPDGMEPALAVKDYSSFWYRELYSGIDLNYYGVDLLLKYDYHLSPRADWRQIRIRVEGATPSLLPDGTLILDTPWGTIEEEAPVAYQESGNIEVKWVVQGNVISFHIGEYDQTQALVIDPPVRVWGTYYGGSGQDVSRSCEVDDFGHVYLAGHTNSINSVATLGTHQTQFGGGLEDAFLAKFNDDGVLLWATYYGGSESDWGMSCAVDVNSDVYLAGWTRSANAIANTGVHQSQFGGGLNDAFLVKFDNDGFRLWGTYYGGNDYDDGVYCTVDMNNHVYLAGWTSSTNAIATVGAHQEQYGGINDAFLVKFDYNGVRLWGTYYGGSKLDISSSCAVDENGHVYLAGETHSTNAIATTGAHQEQYGEGPGDAFIAKFNSNGVRLWGTYYGGSGSELAHSCMVDVSGYVYISGHTTSTIGITTVDGHQEQYGGGTSDAFLVKFNSNGVRSWGTYYGGSDGDWGRYCTVDVNGHVYLAGETASTNYIATLGAHQMQNGGGTDAFIAKFNSNCELVWGSYYGGTGNESSLSCNVDANGYNYLVGVTNSIDAMATPGAHQSQVNGGLYDSFLAKFSDNEVSSVEWKFSQALDNSLYAWPNPFTETLNFSYELKYKSFTRATLYDTKGNLVITLDEGTYPSSKREVQISLKELLNAGIYLIVLEIDGCNKEVIRVVKK